MSVSLCCCGGETLRRFKVGVALHFQHGFIWRGTSFRSVDEFNDYVVAGHGESHKHFLTTRNRYIATGGIEVISDTDTIGFLPFDRGIIPISNTHTENDTGFTDTRVFMGLSSFGPNPTGTNEYLVTQTDQQLYSDPWTEMEMMDDLSILIEAIDLTMIPAGDEPWQYIDDSGKAFEVYMGRGAAFFTTEAGGFTVEYTKNSGAIPGAINGRQSGVLGRTNYYPPTTGNTIFAGACLNPNDNIKDFGYLSAIMVKSIVDDAGYTVRTIDSPWNALLSGDRCRAMASGKYPVILGGRPIDFERQPDVRHELDWGELEGVPSFIQLDLNPC